jgi:serine/threonine protein kinase
MGEVWLSEDPRLKRQVALKTLPPSSQQNQEFANRFEREAKAVASLTHPHILPIYDYGKHPLADDLTQTYLVMPYIAGGSLATLLSPPDQFLADQPTGPNQGARISPAEAFLLLKQAAEAIDFAHQKQIIHRDIKPSNLLLRDPSWLLLADFGIARLLNSPEQSSRLTRSGQSLGTPEYMAPEQIQGQATITSDIYSLAIIIYQIFTGRVPFQEETALATMMRQLSDPPPLPQQFNPILSSTFTTILLGGLHKDPRQRPALASEFVAQLERAHFDPSYSPTPPRTLREVPALVFGEDTPKNAREVETPLVHSTISRRQILLHTGTAAAILAGSGLGAWGVVTNAQSAPPGIPAPPTITARPARTGKNLPALVLSGYCSVYVDGLSWTNDSQTLISSGADGQVLRWNIPQLVRQPDGPYGTPLYTGQPLQFGSTYFPLPLRGSPILTTLSLDGTLLAVANTAAELTKAQITIYRFPNLEIFAQIEFARDPADMGSIYTMAWLPDNYLMYSQLIWPQEQDRDQRIVTVVDTKQPNRSWIIENVVRSQSGSGADAETVQSLLAPYSSTSPTRAIVYDKTIVIGDVSITDKANWQVRARIPYDGDTFTPNDWSNNGKTIAGILEVEQNNQTVTLPGYIADWQANDPRVVAVKAPETKDESRRLLVCCNPQATMPTLAMGTAQGEVFLWDLKESAAPVRKLESEAAGFVRSLSWSPDGRWLAAGFGDKGADIVIWEL